MEIKHKDTKAQRHEELPHERPEPRGDKPFLRDPGVFMPLWLHPAQPIADSCWDLQSNSRTGVT